MTYIYIYTYLVQQTRQEFIDRGHLSFIKLTMTNEKSKTVKMNK